MVVVNLYDGKLSIRDNYYIIILIIKYYGSPLVVIRSLIYWTI